MRVCLHKIFFINFLEETKNGLNIKHNKQHKQHKHLKIGLCYPNLYLIGLIIYLIR
jgi:hypothetical protein